MQKFLVTEQFKNKLSEVLRTPRNAIYALGETSILRSNNSVTIDCHQIFAQRGDPSSQAHLGYCYFYDKGVEKSSEKSVKWYKLAAKQGNRDALTSLGNYYKEGYGVDISLTKACELYCKAAEQGDLRAKFELAYCYLNGKGIDKDSAKGVVLLREAAEQDYAQAQLHLGACYFLGTDVTQNYLEAYLLFLRAVDNGDMMARFLLFATLPRAIKSICSENYSNYMLYLKNLYLKLNKFDMSNISYLAKSLDIHNCPIESSRSNQFQ